MPKVSVCIPVYGVEKYIEQCVRSLFGQTLDSMEYVFVDDCSPDSSIAVMQRVLEEFPNRKEQVKIIRHEVNQGLVAARNHGITASTGDYIIHCDSDDWVDLDFYEKMYKRAVETDADVVCSPYRNTYGEMFDTVVPYVCDDVYEYVKKSGCHLYHLWSKLYKREIALNQTLYCPETINVSEDILRNIQMLDLCKKISFVSGVYYYYRRNVSSSYTYEFKEQNFLNEKETCDILLQKYGDKYSMICRNRIHIILVRALRFLHKTPSLEKLFREEWAKIPFLTKVKIFLKEKSWKAKVALLSAIFSVNLTISFLRRVLN